MLVFCGCFNYDRSYVHFVEKNKGINRRCCFLIANTDNFTIECYTSLEIQRNSNIIKGLKIEGLNLDVFGEPYKWSDSIDNAICKIVRNTILMKDYRYRVTRLLYNLRFIYGSCTVNFMCSEKESTVLEFNDYVSKDLLSFQSCMRAFCFNRINLSRYYDLDILDFRPYDMSKISNINIINNLTQSNLKELYFGNLNLAILRKLDNIASLFICLEIMDFTDCFCDCIDTDKNFNFGFLSMNIIRFVLLNKNTPLFNKSIVQTNNLVTLTNTINMKDSIVEINKIKAKSILLCKLDSNNAIIINK